MVRTDEDPFRQPPRGRSAAATSPEGGGKGEVRIRPESAQGGDCRARAADSRPYGGDGVGAYWREKRARRKAGKTKKRTIHRINKCLDAEKRDIGELYK